MNDQPKTARELYKGFLGRLEGGELSPYRKRLDEKQRMSCCGKLIKSRGHRYAKCSLENYEVSTDQQKQAVKLLKGFAERMPDILEENDGGGLVFTGPPGTGKDHLMMALMISAVLDWGLSVVWTDGLQLFQQIKNSISQGQSGTEIARYTKPQILGISDPVPPRDDLTAYEMGCIRQIIDARYSAGLSTWITTNIRTAEEAKERLTPAILGRLMDKSFEVKCEWSGYRAPSTKRI